MLQKVGLLPVNNLEQLPFAYAMYARDDYEGLLLSTQFKRTFSIDVRIKFLGVWYVIQPVNRFLISSPCRDTVHSVGLIEKHLPFTGTNNAISYFRHALSLDERRVKFRPFFCTVKKAKNDDKDTKASEYDEDSGMDDLRTVQGHRGSRDVEDFEESVNSHGGTPTDVKEVFFAGCHCGMFRSIHIQ